MKPILHPCPERRRPSARALALWVLIGAALLGALGNITSPAPLAYVAAERP